MRALLAALPVAFLAACGGSGSPTFTNAADVAAAGGCSSVEDVAKGDLQYFVSDSAVCELNGNRLTVNWFKAENGFKSYKAVADEVSDSGVIYGKRWAVECPDDEADCKQFKKAAESGKAPKAVEKARSAEAVCSDLNELNPNPVDVLEEVADRSDDDSNFVDTGEADEAGAALKVLREVRGDAPKEVGAVLDRLLSAAERLADGAVVDDTEVAAAAANVRILCPS